MPIFVSYSRVAVNTRTSPCPFDGARTTPVIDGRMARMRSIDAPGATCAAAAGTYPCSSASTRNGPRSFSYGVKTATPCRSVRSR